MSFNWSFGPIVIIAMCLLITTNQSEPDIYWRPYYGVIPDDAIRHPQEKVVARAFIKHRSHVISGGITSEEPYLHDIYKIEPNDFIEILCSKHPEKFKWVPTTSKKAPNVTEKIQAGYYYDSLDPLYIYYGSGIIYGVSSKYNFLSYYIITPEEGEWRDNYDLLIYES